MAETRGLRRAVRGLYYGDSRTARVFRYALLAFDIVTVAFFIVSSMVAHEGAFIVVDLAIAALLVVDYLARATAANRPWRFPLRFDSLVDLVVIGSLLAPLFLHNFAFLRVVRMLRLLRSYHLLKQLRDTSKWFRRHEEVVQSTINLFVFVFVVTAVVFVLESQTNPAIGNYFDALYYTVSTLTTTGFGDITMDDTVGRIMTILIMVFGVALFLRLLQTIFRPPKVTYECPTCGLTKHDPDAVHCKHCGETVHITTEGDWA